LLKCLVLLLPWLDYFYGLVVALLFWYINSFKSSKSQRFKYQNASISCKWLHNVHAILVCLVTEFVLVMGEWFVFLVLYNPVTHFCFITYLYNMFKTESKKRFNFEFKYTFICEFSEKINIMTKWLVFILYYLKNEDNFDIVYDLL
jgi:hypothetical protein